MKTSTLWIAGILGALTLQAATAQAWGDYGRDDGDRDDRGGGGYSSACQSAIDNVRYCQDQVSFYSSLASGNSCGADIACKYTQAQALQYTIQQLQSAESARASACN